jgi:polyphosphate kinase 2 (PPK2 family)
MFMQRYIERFPAAGEIVIFDRSWYNRAGVEYVMGFCSAEQNRRFLELCPEVEKYIVDAGIILIKIWLEVGKDEQERRFSARIKDPLRQWKLSPMDVESYDAGTITRGRATRCWRKRVAITRLGTSYVRTTNGGRGSTASSIS